MTFKPSFYLMVGMLLALTAAGLLMITSLTWVINRDLLKPVQRNLQALKRDGLTIRLESKVDNELGVFFKAVNRHSR